MSPTPSESPRVQAEVSPAPAFTAPPAADTTLTDSWVTIRKRKWIILGFAMLGFIYGWYQASIQPRLYDAGGTIEIHSGQSAQYKVSGYSTNTDGGLTTQLVILKSSTLLLSVARDMNLANNSDFAGYSTVYRNIDDPVIRQNIVAQLGASISVANLPRTDIVAIHCVTANPKLSADIVNKLVLAYINNSFESREQSTKRVTDFFAHTLDSLKQEVDNSQQKMIDLQKRLGALGFNTGLNQVTSDLADISKATSEAEINRLQAETRYHFLANLDPRMLDQSAEGLKTTNIMNLRAQLDEAENKLDSYKVLYGPNNPKMLTLNKQIEVINQQLAAEGQRLITETKQAYTAALKEEEQTQAALQQKQDDAYKLRDDLLEFNLRSRDYNTNQALYDGLHQRLRTAGVEAGLESTEIDIIDQAYPPLGPTLKPRSSMLVVNTVVMLIVGLVVAFLLDSLDTGLRTVAEIESVSNLPSLALIPRGRRIATEGTSGSPAMRNLGLLANPKSQFAEAFRALRTSLLLSVAGGEPKTILLSSATPGEGKTTVSINLACVLAQRNVRVLLIDADLRRPTVHHRFGLNGKVGLTSVLTGTISLEDAIQRVPEMPLLDILPSGPVPPFPTEMLGSQTMHDLLVKCKGIYTHIVMDSPPLLSVTDSVVLAREADAVVMIVRHGKSSKQALRRGRDLLLRSGSRVTGIVLNAVDLSSPEYYAYYGYYGYTAYAAAGVDSGGWEAKNGERNGETRNGEAGDAAPAKDNRPDEGWGGKR